MGDVTTDQLQNIINKTEPTITKKISWGDDQEKIFEICKKYYELCLACAKDSDLYDSFTNPKNTIAFLTDGKLHGESKYVFYFDGEEKIPFEGVGMILPKQGLEIVLDHHTAWPTLLITPKDKIADDDKQKIISIKESPMVVEKVVLSDRGESQTVAKVNKDAPTATMNLGIDDLDNYNQTLVMPNYIPNTDMLLTIKANENAEAEIIMTCC
ncbi:hypothetical protein SAMN04487910_3025 [Aquimarina amphilecti]|uniref:Uncharacterized protein n=1 Tax=Aquimarina amphilecti TaxID=1038014 RepID=A0A1H7S9M4_AQUAM|nr:hypothetical protein [Aquimarina amphilecti]SEL68247.1 hypothetical protein SAMN04487910_3025 [Aquimarina amphilecti]